MAPKTPVENAPQASALAGLLERVRAATGPDRVLNGDVLMAFGWASDGGIAIDPEGRRVFQIPDATLSLDAALALVERVLPGWVWTVMTDYGDLCRARLYGEVNGGRDHGVQADGATPALALLAALLSALSDSNRSEVTVDDGGEK